HRLMQNVIEKRRHPHDRLRLQLAEQTNLAVGAKNFSAAAAHDKVVELHSAVMPEPKSKMRRVRKRVQQTEVATRLANLVDAAATTREVGEVVLRVEKGD